MNNNKTLKGDKVKQMAALSAAADAACDGDIVTEYVRGRQRWDLLTQQAMMNIRVAYKANGFIAHAGFPEWMGKNSTRRQ